MTCQKCGNIRFWDATAYRQHVLEMHNTRVQLKAYNFTGRSKAAIIEDTETAIRGNAWDKNKLNPLIGMSNDSVEPQWNELKELI